MDTPVTNGYRKSIFLIAKNSQGKEMEYLQTVCTSPADTRRMLHLLRVANPKRVYTTNDPQIN